MGLNGAEFARMIGISRSAVNQLENGSTKELKSSTAAAIERVSGYSAAWLSDGKGPRMRRESGDPDDQDVYTRIIQGFAKLQPEEQGKILSDIDFLLSLREKK